MAAVVLNGHTYSLAILSGTDGRDYARPETITSSGATLWDLFFTDLVATLASATSLNGLSPGAAGGYARSNGSAWVRVSGLDPADLSSAVGYTKGGTGLTTLGTTGQNLGMTGGIIGWVNGGTSPGGTMYTATNFGGF